MKCFGCGELYISTPLNEGYCFKCLLKMKDNKIKKLEDKLQHHTAKIIEEIKDLAGDYFEESNHKLILTAEDLTEILEQIEQDNTPKTLKGN